MDKTAEAFATPVDLLDHGRIASAVATAAGPWGHGPEDETKSRQGSSGGDERAII